MGGHNIFPPKIPSTFCQEMNLWKAALILMYFTGSCECLIPPHCCFVRLPTGAAGLWGGTAAFPALVVVTQTLKP